MDESPLISIIVPIYGVDKYIERCAKSLFNQTMKSGIEYIFVDDCSPDCSIEILKRVIEEYPQIKSNIKIVAHSENKGLPQARATGFAHSSGQYIIHCDSDDWMEERACELLVKNANKTNADIIIYDYYENDTVTRKKIDAIPSKDLDKMKIIAGMLTLKTPNCVWNKMAKRCLYETDEFIFPRANMGEDLVITYQLFSKASSISRIPVPLYNYYINNNSISRSLTIESVKKRFTGLCDNTEKIIELIKRDGYTRQFKQELIFRKILAKIALNPLLGYKDYRKIWVNTFREVNLHTFLVHIPIQYKIIFLLVLINVYPSFMKHKYRDLY